MVIYLMYLSPFRRSTSSYALSVFILEAWLIASTGILQQLCAWAIPAQSSGTYQHAVLLPFIYESSAQLVIRFFTIAYLPLPDCLVILESYKFATCITICSSYCAIRMEDTVTTGLANLDLESPPHQPYTPPSTGHPGAVSRTRRKELLELAEVIRKSFVPTADKCGIVYAAKACMFQRHIVKVGFSVENSPKRVKDIERRCKQPVDHFFLTPAFVGAYKAEQIIHKVLAPQAYEIFNCGCWGPNREPGIHREWFEENFDWVKALISTLR